MRWKAKPHACIEVDCPDCGGRGEYSGYRLGWSDDEDKRCKGCNGRGRIHNGYVREPIPEWPRGLGAHLRETLEAYEPPTYIVGIDHHPV